MIFEIGGYDPLVVVAAAVVVPLSMSIMIALVFDSITTIITVAWLFHNGDQFVKPVYRGFHFGKS